MPGNLDSTSLTKTTNYFNNYFQTPVAVDQNINDSILSFFEEQTGNKESAKLLVQTVIETAKANREDPITVLNKFQKMPIGELNALLAAYLNTTRVNTSLLGVKKTPLTNPFVERSIIV